MPSFAIEAEGETIPLSIQDIYQTLAKTAGTQATQQSLQVSAKQLGNWEKTPGYYSLLQEVYSDFSIDDSIRLQAIIQLKNGIDKHWRKTSSHPIQKGEKDTIKVRAIDIGVQETRKNLALQNALMLAKIVRTDFPHDWPDAISLLIQHLRSASNEQASAQYVANILVLTLQVIKELATGALMRTKRSLQSVAPELVNVLGQLYVTIVQRWTSSQTADEQMMINSYAALKVSRRLMVSGFEYPHKDEAVKQIWQILQQHCDTFWAAWTQNNNNVLLAKHLLQIYKLWLEMARQHPASFVSLGCMDILGRCWTIVNGNQGQAADVGQVWDVLRNGDIDEEDSPLDKLSLKALLLFRACIKMVFNPANTFKYHHAEDKEDRKAAVEQVKNQVFTEQFVIQLMEILVTHYFVLRPADLRDWEQEPDEWERREEEIADAWEFSLRSCSEKLFLDLVINFKRLLVPRLLQVFQEYANINNQNVLLKDSLYSAIGIAAACIEDVFDINTFIRTTLVPEVRMVQPNYNLLRRRTAILLGQWTPIKPEQIDLPAVYDIFNHLLLPNDALNDHVVRVTAGRQLKMVLEPFEFSYEQFQPFTSTMLENIMKLVQETELSETQMALLETIRVAITKLGRNIEPFAPWIMSMLPPIWQESGDEHLIKQAILSMITSVMQSLGEKSVDMHILIYPLIRDAVQPDSEASVYLLEEGLDLWAAVLAQTPSQSPSQEVVSLVTSLLPLLELGSEHLRMCFEIFESYTIVSPKIVLAPEILTPFFHSQKLMLPVLNSSKARDASQSPQVIQTLVQSLSIPGYCADNEQRLEFLQRIIMTMIDTGYLKDLFDSLYEAYSYHQDPRLNRRPPDIIGVGETSLFTLLSHLVLADTNTFLSAISHLQQISNTEILPWLLVEWFNQYDSTPDTIRRKTQMLALTALLADSTNPEPLLKSLQSLFGLYTDTLTELADGAADENRGDYLFSPAPTGEMSPPNPERDSPEDVRKRHVTNWDVAYVINAREFVAEKLKVVIQKCGGQDAFASQWINGVVDEDIVKSFAQLGLW